MQRFCKGYVDVMPLNLCGSNPFCISGMNGVFMQGEPLHTKKCAEVAFCISAIQVGFMQRLCRGYALMHVYARFMQRLCRGYALMHVYARVCSPKGALLHKCITRRVNAEVAPKLRPSDGTRVFFVRFFCC